MNILDLVWMLPVSESTESLDFHHFDGLVGQTFRIGDYESELKELREGPETPPRFRRQFTLIFRFPPDFPHDSITLPVSHPQIGTHDFFINKIIGWEEEFDLQVVFN